MTNTNPRRRFLTQLSGLAAGSFAIRFLDSCASAEKKEQKKEEKMEKKVEKQVANDKLGIALVGLGKYSEGQLGPALKETRHCFLAGVVTGSPTKAKDWKAKYNLPDQNIYNYSNFDTIKDNPDIHIVYVVLPNSMHMEYVIRAAKAGKHVICEKPMALSVAECDKMIAACEAAGVRLSIGYRLRFEPHNREMMRIAKEEIYGPLKKVTAKDGMAQVDGWRLDKALAGGGPLMDVGIYCVQAARYVTDKEPIAVTAKEIPKTNPTKFSTIEEGVSFQLEFANGNIADCECSYSKDMNLLHAEASRGWFELSPAYAYEGIKGKASDGEINMPKVIQQAIQMDDFAKVVKTKGTSAVPGEMGRQDLKIIEAIYEAMRTGKKVTIS